MTTLVGHLLRICDDELLSRPAAKSSSASTSLESLFAYSRCETSCSQIRSELSGWASVIFVRPLRGLGAVLFGLGMLEYFLNHQYQHLPTLEIIILVFIIYLLVV